MIEYIMALFSSGLWIQHWHVGASLADSCCAAFQVACLTSFFLSNINTQSLPLLFQCHCPVWSSVFFFSLVGLHPPIFLHLYSHAAFLLTSATPFLFVCGFVFPHFSSLVTSLLQCCPTHLSWHHSHHAVTVPRWTKGWVWFPAVQEFHVSRFCQQIFISVIKLSVRPGASFITLLYEQKGLEMWHFLS